MIRPVPPARPGPWTDDGLTETSSTPARRAAAKRRELALVLGALVDREVGPAVRRVLAPDGAVRLAERGRRRGQHDAPHARARGGAHSRLGAAHVDVQQRGRIVGAQRVDAGDVVEQLAARHPLRQRVLVEHVAAHDPCRARGERAARPRPSAPAPTSSSPRSASRAGERAADQAAAAGQEDAGHVARSPRWSAGSARTR